MLIFGLTYILIYYKDSSDWLYMQSETSPFLSDKPLLTYYFPILLRIISLAYDILLRTVPAGIFIFFAISS